MGKRKFKVPHTLVILFTMVVLAQILTYVIPAGSFDRVETPEGRLQVVLNEGGVVDTMVHAISLPLQQLPGAVSAVGMFFAQSLANFFIPSGSGQAFVTMPIMAPLADLVAVLIGYS